MNKPLFKETLADLRGAPAGEKPVANHSVNYAPWLMTPVGVMLFVLLWQIVVWAGDYPAFILPSPAAVAKSFGDTLQSGALWQHTWATLQAVLGGLLLGGSSAVAIGYALAKNRLVEQFLAPYIVASQSVPVVAIAPLLIIWFGAGYLSKVMTAALIVFFPILVNTVVGIRGVDENLRELMRVLRANRWDSFRWLELPAALPVLLGGFKVGITLSVIGAVVGEFVGADQGLGFLINQARGLFNTPLVFTAIFALVILAMSLYGLISLLEWRLLRDRRS